MDGAGTVKEPSFRFITFPCWTENVWSCAKQVFIIMVLASIGNILVRIFTSSTCVTVQTFHCCDLMFSWRMLALSRNLIQQKPDHLKKKLSSIIICMGSWPFERNKKKNRKKKELNYWDYDLYWLRRKLLFIISQWSTQN